MARTLRPLCPAARLSLSVLLAGFALSALTAAPTPSTHHSAAPVPRLTPRALPAHRYERAEGDDGADAGVEAGNAGDADLHLALDGTNGGAVGYFVRISRSPRNGDFSQGE